MRVALTLLLACIAGAEIIDRVAVTVDKRVITESEIVRQIRITAFLNNEQPDFSASSKRVTADRLVEQVLIRRELESTRYSAPAPVRPRLVTMKSNGASKMMPATTRH